MAAEPPPPTPLHRGGRHPGWSRYTGTGAIPVPLSVLQDLRAVFPVLTLLVCLLGGVTLVEAVIAAVQRNWVLAGANVLQTLLSAFIVYDLRTVGRVLVSLLRRWYPDGG